MSTPGITDCFQNFLNHQINPEQPGTGFVRSASCSPSSQQVAQVAAYRPHLNRCSPHPPWNHQHPDEGVRTQ
jgi:hypothetical protein